MYICSPNEWKRVLRENEVFKRLIQRNTTLRIKDYCHMDIEFYCKLINTQCSIKPVNRQTN